MTCSSTIPLSWVVRVAAAFLAVMSSAAFAQGDYPSRTIKIVVPLPPGPVADVVPRLIGEKLTAKWGQPVIIENRPGAALNLGAEAVARAEPAARTHRSLNQDAPVSRPVQQIGRIVSHTQIGGLHHQYVQI
jgi:tripartite-type tricarboxylate transporter receptor subunit TctC